MDMNTRIFWQEEVERKYNRKHIDGYIREALQASAAMQEKMAKGVALVEAYMAKDYYASKDARIAQLVGMDLPRLVEDIFVGVAYVLRPELLTSVTGQLAGRLRFSDRVEAITTVAELLAVVCATDGYDITKAGRMGSLMVVSRLQLDPELVEFIENSEYLPPMICEPKELTSNYSSGYLTHEDSLVLGGAANHHEGDLCLDVLNRMNKVALRLDMDFLRTVEEAPSFEIETQEQAEQWQRFRGQSAKFYALMVKTGNRFHLTHKVDKRGRIYSCGYHISTQGTAYKKAAIEFAMQEHVEVPDVFRR